MPKVDIFPISSNKRPYSKRLHIYVALQTLREKYDYVKGNRAYYFIRPDFMKTFIYKYSNDKYDTCFLSVMSQVCVVNFPLMF